MKKFMSSGLVPKTEVLEQPQATLPKILADRGGKVILFGSS
jgi:hypothetical protein